MFYGDVLPNRDTQGIRTLPDQLLIKFDGGIAEQHFLPAYEGGESLSGIGLTFTRVAHYLITGEVRHRAPYDNRLQILTHAPRDGCVMLDIFAILNGSAPVSFIGQVGLAITSQLVFDTGLYLIRKIVGQHSSNCGPDRRIISPAFRRHGRCGFCHYPERQEISYNC